MESLEGRRTGRGIASVPTGGGSVTQKSQLSEFLVILMDGVTCSASLSPSLTAREICISPNPVQAS